jgi:hypothetical protein
MQTLADDAVIDALAVAVATLLAADEATRSPLSLDEMERIEQLEDRLVGLRQSAHEVRQTLELLLHAAARELA